MKRMTTLAANKSLSGKSRISEFTDRDRFSVLGITSSIVLIVAHCAGAYYSWSVVRRIAKRDCNHTSVRKRTWECSKTKRVSTDRFSANVWIGTNGGGQSLLRGRRPQARRLRFLDSNGRQSDADCRPVRVGM